MALIEKRIFRTDGKDWTGEDSDTVTTLLSDVVTGCHVTLKMDEGGDPREAVLMIEVEADDVSLANEFCRTVGATLGEKGYTCRDAAPEGIGGIAAGASATEEVAEVEKEKVGGKDETRLVDEPSPHSSAEPYNDLKLKRGKSEETATAVVMRRALPVFVPILCIVVAFSVLLTFTLTARYYKEKTPYISEEALTFPELELIHRLYEENTIYEIDREQLLEAILKGYAVGTGDLYAQYYTAQEYAEMTADRTGKEYCGIGVKVTESTITYENDSMTVVNVVSIFHGSMATEAGMRVGDLIVGALNADGVSVSVQDAGLDGIVQCITGEEGTIATIYVLRPEGNGEYSSHTFEIERRKIISESVTARVSDQDASVGIVCISDFSSFDMPRQFKVVMQELIEQGCNRFVLDVRNNLGGYLIAVESVLSMLLQPGDLMISQVYNSGNTESDYVGQGMSFLQCSSYCNLTSEDLGIFHDYDYVVLTNEYTASAAELFSANLRDYQMATLVGTTTFGKGIVQNTYDLSRYGMKGALKMTVAEYLPPCGEGFHGKGIAPDVEVELDSALIEKYGNVYLIPDSENPQFIQALQILQSAEKR